MFGINVISKFVVHTKYRHWLGIIVPNKWQFLSITSICQWIYGHLTHTELFTKADCDWNHPLELLMLDASDKLYTLINCRCQRFANFTISGKRNCLWTAFSSLLWIIVCTFSAMESVLTDDEHFLFGLFSVRMSYIPHFDKQQINVLFA